MESFFIATYTGGAVDLADPKPEQISIIDIAVSLTRMCRFTCHCLTEYSVANHSLFVSSIVTDPTLRLAALLHDAHETYTNDQSTPLKNYLRAIGEYDGLNRVKQSLDKAIARRFGFDPELFSHPDIKEADLISLSTEKRDNLKDNPFWQNANIPRPHARPLEILDDKTTYAAFMSAFNALTGLNMSIIYPPR